MLVALLLWTVLDAPALARSAEGSHLGTRRRAALDLLKPVAALDRAVGLAAVTGWVESALGHGVPPMPRVASASGASASTRTAPDRSPATRHEAPRVASAPAAPAPAAPAPATPAATDPAAVDPPATTTIPAVPTPTTADPLRVLIVGDSMASDLGNRMAARLAAGGTVATTLDTRPATGLARPDAFDWPTQLAADVAHDHPQVVVALFGTNDAQGMPLPTGPAAFGSTEWNTTYRARVQQVAAIAAGAGARLLWIGEPVMRSALFDQRMQQLDGVVQAALGGDGQALYSDTRPVLATADGAYADALPGPDGLQLVRQDDGIHLSWDGADRLAAYEIQVLQQWLNVAL
jgi:hypothetical protein